MPVKKIKTVSQSAADEWHYLNAINWYLKLNHQKNSHSKFDYEWTRPISLADTRGDADLQDTCNAIVQEQIDILALCVYTWNKRKLLTLAKLVKEKLPDVIVVAGGPELDAHQNTNFFTQHNFIDYVVYGEGEIAFGQLLDHIAGYDTELVNVVDSSGHVYPHEVFMDRDILKQSPILLYQDEICEYVNATRESIQIYSPNTPLAFLWETVKGCAFKCSFCDWSSGLHNKVRIWGKGELEPAWKKELLFFSKLGIDGIYWTNPNVGMIAQDEDIVNFWCDLKLSDPSTPVNVWPQLAKTQKDRAFRLLDRMLETGLTNYCKFDLQDLDREVLKNIDRPEIPWEEHKILIKNLMHRHRDKLNYQKTIDGFHVNAFLIWGLPGQTLKNWLHNAREVISLGLFPHYQPFEVLPNSPAGRIEYQKKFELKTKNITLHDRRDILTVTSSYSMSEKEWFTGMLLTYLLLISDFVAENIDIDPFFFNFIKLTHVIDDSYEYFQQTAQIKLLVNKNEVDLHEMKSKKFWRKLLKQPNSD